MACLFFQSQHGSNEFITNLKKATNSLSPFLLFLLSPDIYPLVLERIFYVGGGLRWPHLHFLSVNGQPVDGARVRIQVTAGKGGLTVHRAGGY